MIVFKKFGRIKKIAIAILLSMVFAVNVGVTWASLDPDYEMNVSSKQATSVTDDSYSYISDVVVNNSTTLTPISYTNGTVAREISFDYGFSEATDVAIVYELSYTDGTAVNNVILNVVDRDDYVLDVPTVNMQNGVTAYNQQASRGTLYYLKTLNGSGNQKVFSGVTFAENNNQVSSYKADSSLTLYYSIYDAGIQIDDIVFQYLYMDIARYWEPSAYSNGTTEVTTEEYQSLSASEQLKYSISKYKAIQQYTVATESSTLDSVSVNTVVDVASYKNKLKIGDSMWTDSYMCCVESCTIGEANYVYGQEISVSTYNSLTTENKENFQHINNCSTKYWVKGASSRTVATGETITSDEYSKLYALEQAEFSPSSYVGYENKRLKISVSVHTQLNVSATGQTASEYYDENHHFINFKQQLVSRAYENWLLFKQKTDSNGNGSVGANKIMIYNAHGSFKTGLQYAYDFSSGADITSYNNTPNITSQYIYSTDTTSAGKFYAYAGGNRYNGGLGIYYMSSSQASINVSIGYNWYDPKGNILESTAVSNVVVQPSSKFNNYSGNNYGLKSLVGANSWGYIDLLDYIEITTKTDIFNLIGCRLVITTVEASLTTDYSSWAPTGTYQQDGVTVNSSSVSSPVLYKYAEMATATTLDANLSVTNNSDVAKNVVITVKPKFYAYNSQTGDSFGLAKLEESIQFGDSGASGTRINYKATSWTKSGTSSYSFSSNGIYVAPHTTIDVIDSVYMVGQTLDNWKVTIGGVSFYSDYWFVLEVTSVTATDATTNKTTTASAELITDLLDGTINSGTAYISLRNNTSQIMSNVSFSGKLVNMSNSSSTVGYTLLNYSTNSSSSNTQTSTISVTFNSINLLPGESIILAKITLNSGSNVGLSTANVSCSLGGTPSYTSMYAKRDFASGNLSLVNASQNINSVELNLKNFAQNVTLSDVSLLTGGNNKWSYSTSFKYKEKSTSDLAYIHPNQLLNVLTNYYAHDIQLTIK